MAEPGERVVFKIPGMYYDSNTPCKLGCGEKYNTKEGKWEATCLPWKNGEEIVIESLDLRERENDARANPIHVFHYYTARDALGDLYKFMDSYV